MSHPELFNEQRVERLKREAWATKKATGKRHHLVLREIAQREGFKDWEALTRASKETPA